MPNGGGEPVRDRTPLVPAGYHEIDVMPLRAGCDGTGRISDADIDAMDERTWGQSLRRWTK